MIYTFTIESSKGLHKPSLYACTSLSFDVQENAAISLPVMLDGSIRVQSLAWGSLTISVSGGGFVAPHLDDVPLGELLTLHSANQVSRIVPVSVPVTVVPTVDGVTAPSGFKWVRMSMAAFSAVLPARNELHYEPILSALYVDKDERGADVLDVFEGENYRTGDMLHALVPVTYAALRVSYFPKYKCYLTQPMKVTTGNNDANISWSMEFVARVDRSAA